MGARHRLEILAPAQRELDEIALVFMELSGVDAALKITDRILNALEHLKEQPAMGVPFRDKTLRLDGYRMLICGRYICVYRKIGDVVYVYHIVDGRANYPRLLSDLPEGEA